MRHLFLIIACLLLCFLAGSQQIRLGIPLGHTREIIQSSFSHDGNYVLTASKDRTVKIWEVASQKLVAEFVSPDGDIKSALFSQNDKQLLVATAGSNLARVWNIASREMVFYVRDSVANLQTAGYSPDGSRILTVSVWGGLQVWDAATGRLVCSPAGSINQKDTARILNMLRSNSSTGGLDKSDVEIQIKEFKRIFEGDSSRIQYFSPDGKIILSKYGDSVLKTWDAATGKLISTIVPASGIISAASFSATGQMIAIGCNNGAILTWDVSLQKFTQKKLKISPDRVNYLAFSPDGKTLLSCQPNAKVSLWNVESGKMLNQLPVAPYRLVTATFLANEGRIITTEKSNEIKIWDAKSLSLLATLTGHSKNITQLSFHKKTGKLLTAGEDLAARLWDIATGRQSAIFSGNAHLIKSIDISPNHSLYLINNSSDAVWVYKTGNNSPVARLAAHKGSINSAVFSHDSKNILTASTDQTMKTWDAQKGSVISTFTNIKSASLNAVYNENDSLILTMGRSNLLLHLLDAGTGKELRNFIGPKKEAINAFDIQKDGSKIISASNDGTAIIWDAVKGGMLQKLKVFSPGINRTYSGSGLIIDPERDTVLTITDPVSGKTTTKEAYAYDVLFAAFSPNERQVMTASDNGMVFLWDSTSSSEPAMQIMASRQPVSFAAYNETGNEIWARGWGDSLKAFDANTGARLHSIPLDKNFEIKKIDHKKGIVYAANNAELGLFSLKEGKHLLSFFCIDSTDWAVVHPSGLFDASPGAMEKMYWVKGLEIIELGQIKSRYYQPFLWKMVMNGTPLRSVEGMEELKMYPLAELGSLEDGILPVTLYKRDGGYGQVSILINKKEVVENALDNNPDHESNSIPIRVNIKPYLVKGMDNEILIRTESADGFVKSRGIGIIHKEQGPLSLAAPSFYAVICGTSEYSNPNINLQFSGKDARSMAKALGIAASNLFGKDSTHIFLLTSPGDSLTSKKNIAAVFNAIKSKAKPEDIVMVYLSGHGLSMGAEKGDFFYLTNEASIGDYDDFKDPVIRQKQAISTTEFTKWLKDIPALKQIMIIDACGSGKAVDKMITQRDIDPSQIKAIDRMRDRTGLYILSGCTADAESFESNAYGQGLLTYTILQAIKGAALRENGYVDLLTLLNYASDQVPIIAAGVGGIQKPQILVNKTGSFDIGRIRDEDKSQIPLAQVKPVFFRSTLLEETKKRDILKLSQALNNQLREYSYSPGGDNRFIFLDTDDYPGGCSFSGGYLVEGNLLHFTGSLLCGDKEEAINLKNQNKEQLMKSLVELANKRRK